MRMALTATKFTHPVREWEFLEQPITLPTPQWYMYAGLVVLFVGSGTGVYYLRLYHHPLLVQLSASPQALSHLPLEQLAQAQRLLQRTGRLTTVLATSAIQQPWLQQAIAFARTSDPPTRCTSLAARLRAACEPVPTDHLALFKLRMGDDFMLNIEYWLLVLPPEGMDAHDVLTYLQQVEDTRLFAIIEAKFYGAPHQAKMRFRLLCSFRNPYAILWISLILLLNPSVLPFV
jgi:hypothetical protein